MQIVSIDAAHGKSLQLTGNNTDTPTFRVMWKNGVRTNWPARNGGNDILKISASLFTGPDTGGSARKYLAVFNNDYTKILTAVGYNYSNQKLFGYYYYTNPSGVANIYAITLGSNIYPTNTWIDVSSTFDYNTGIVKWTTPAGTFSPPVT